jgi:hypothetical protein
LRTIWGSWGGTADWNIFWGCWARRGDWRGMLSFDGWGCWGCWKGRISCYWTQWFYGIFA